VPREHAYCAREQGSTSHEGSFGQASRTVSNPAASPLLAEGTDELPTTEHVEMAVLDDLAALLAGVDGDPVAGVDDALAPGDGDALLEQDSQELRVVRELRQGRRVRLGDHQDVDRRLRVDVAERQGSVGL